MNKVFKFMTACMVAFTAMFSSSFLAISHATEETVVIIDDTDERFVYSAGNANNGGWEAWDDGSGKPEVSEHWSNTAGATLDIHFDGTKFELYGKKAPEHAMFSIRIDEGETVKCDSYGANVAHNQKLFESATLSEGEHIAHITVLGERNSNSTGTGNVYGVQFVYAKAYGGKIVEKTFTDVDDKLTTSTNELFKIQYEPESRWHAEAGYPNLFFDGTDHYSDQGTTKDFYSMEFVGTGVELYGSKNTAHANADVYIDDVKVGTAASNLASGSTQHKQLIFSKKDLTDGTHTLKVVRGEETKALQIDKIRVFHGKLQPTAIEFTQDELYLGVGQSAQVSVKAIPWNVENPDITWSSTNEDVAIVDENGVVKAISETAAETTIIATVTGTDIKASLRVVVDPTIQALKAYVGDEKLLENQEDYIDLLNQNGSITYNGTAWLKDQLNSKIVVASRTQAVHNAYFTTTDLTDGKGNVIAAENVDVKWVKDIKANIGRGNGSAPVKAFPEVIHKGGKIDVEASTVKFGWVSISIPEDSTAGTYTGTITLNADELDTPIELTYTVEVLNLIQPAPEATELQIWQHPFAVANYYLGLGETPTGGVSNDLQEDFYFTEEHFNLMRASMKEYASIGGHDVVANIVEEAWNHQSYYKDPSMVKWTKKTDGSFEFDYTWYDAWINFQIECGVLDPENGIGQIKCYSIVPWNNQIAYYDENEQRVVKKSHAPGSAEWIALWEPFLRDFMEHSKEMGWFDITYISMDERGLSDLEKAVTMIESVTDEENNHFKISSALNYAAPEYYEFTDRIDDISINQGNVRNEDQMNDLSQHRRERGLKTTYYTCTGDYPSNFIISDPGDNYWNLWYTMTLGTDGYMRWAWDNYVYNMHDNITYRYWEPGDGWFIYPVEREEADDSSEVSFYSTPRYELFKQGIRDVAKAKYLMSQSDELNTEIEALVKSMQRPAQGGNGYGSATAANEEQRMLVHSETNRIYGAITEIAREFVNEKQTDKAELEALVNEASAFDESLYTEASWSDFVAVLENAETVLANAEATQEEVNEAVENLTIAMANLEKAVYTVTVNGEEVYTGAYNDKVTVTAPVVEGKEFTAWLFDGKVISTEETYTFFLSQDLELTPCYEEVNVEAQAILTNTILTKRADNKADIKFVAQLVVPVGYTVENAGLVWSSKEGTELSLENTNLKPTYINTISTSNQFSVTIKGMPAGRFIRGKIFATVVDAEGNESVVYSEEARVVNK